MARTLHSSIRYSPEVEKVINKMPGETFADRFENMVLKYANEEKGLEKRLQQLKNEIDRKNNDLKDLSTRIMKMQYLQQDMGEFYKKLEKIKDTVDKMVQQ